MPVEDNYHDNCRDEDKNKLIHVLAFENEKPEDRMTRN